MLISELERNIEESKEISFPLLAELKDRSFIVLFISERKGTVILSNDEDRDLGMYKDYWISCFNKEIWKILQPGDKVTITQK